uniref:Uncharacterized protein n=1 Tax=Cacopsylla melanoneura TaxID=428564 RepID=A0A8D8XHY3_9HEMI
MSAVTCSTFVIIYYVYRKTAIFGFSSGKPITKKILEKLSTYYGSGSSAITRERKCGTHLNHMIIISSYHLGFVNPTFDLPQKKENLNYRTNLSSRNCAATRWRERRKNEKQQQ